MGYSSENMGLVGAVSPTAPADTATTSGSGGTASVDVPAYPYRSMSQSYTTEPTQPSSSALSGSGGGHLQSTAWFSSNLGLFEERQTDTGKAETLDGSGGSQLATGGVSNASRGMGVSTEADLQSPPAAGLRGSGTSIQLAVDGIIEYDESLLGAGEKMKEKITFQKDLGVPLRFDFPWQERDTEITEWPVKLTSTVAVSLEDPNVLEDFELGVAGTDCEVSVTVEDVTTDSGAGLLLMRLSYTYSCPTDAKLELNLDTGGESVSGSTVATNPSTSSTSESGGSGGSGSTSFSGGSSYSSYDRVDPESRSGSLGSFGCTPPQETDRGEIRMHYSPEPFQSFEATFQFDPSEVQIEEVHADDSVYQQRNKNSAYNYRHRMQPDSVTVDNSNGWLTVEASSGSAINQYYLSEGYDKIMLSVVVRAVGDSGTRAEIKANQFTLYDPDGNEIADASMSGGVLSIDNGVVMESAAVDAGGTVEAPVYGRVGEQFKRYRQVFKFNPDVFGDVAVSGDSAPSMTVIPTLGALDKETRANDYYAVVEGTFDTADRMRQLFDFELTGKSRETLRQRALDLMGTDKEGPPNRTGVDVLQPVGVEQANTGREAFLNGNPDKTGGPGVTYNGLRSSELPSEPIPSPFIGDSTSWGCSSGATYRMQSVKINDPCGGSGEYDPESGFCIPEIGVVYWPLIFDVLVEIPGVDTSAISLDDIAIEITSKTNPAITYSVAPLIKYPAQNTVYVPLSLVIPKAEPQTYPVTYDFQMWIGNTPVSLGGGGGLHVGGDIDQGTHHGRIISKKIKGRMNVGGGPF